MHRFDIGETSSSPHFIGSWMLENGEICDELISLFENGSFESRPGRTGEGLNLSIKDSTDISILPREIEQEGNEPLEHFFNALSDCYQDYVRQWPALGALSKNLEIGNFNLQKYAQGQHFAKSHCERSNLASLHRVLAWMTYLNDVEDSAGGATYFDHYDVSIRPRRGLTLIWPSEWTHFHRGEVLNSGLKYIATGWMHFSQ